MVGPFASLKVASFDLALHRIANPLSRGKPPDRWGLCSPPQQDALFEFANGENLPNYSRWPDDEYDA